MLDRSEAGYTIIEALVAFALLTASLAAVYALISDGARGTIRAVFAAEAAMATSSELDLLRATQKLPHLGVERSVDGSLLRSRVDVIERTGGGGPNAAFLTKVRVTISKPDPSGDLQFSVDAWVPVQAGGAT